MSKLKGYFFTLLTALNWLSLIVAFAPFILMSWLYDLKTTPRISWLRGCLLAQDLSVNVIMGGHHRTYISSLLGHLRLTQSEGGTVMADIVDWLWLKLFKEDNHCVNAMREGDFYDFSARRALLGSTVYWLNLYWIFTL